MPADARWMRVALEAAERERGTAPNPRVGAVLATAERLLALGAHQRAGGPHAEIAALQSFTDTIPYQATLYVTLEPCNHTGRTGPCTETIIARGVRRVVYGCQDPNPRVAGSGLARLRAAGVEVVGPVLEDDALDLLVEFRRWLEQVPMGAIKVAQTLDGYVADAGGRSRWITGAAARARVHALRSDYGLVVTGKGTWLADDPQLNARDAGAVPQPARMVLCRDLPVARHEAAIFRSPEPVYMVAERSTDAAMRSWESGQATVWIVPGYTQEPDRWLARLWDAGLVRYMCEAGPTLNRWMLRHRLVQYAHWFVAPRLLVGQGRAATGAEPGMPLADALTLRHPRYTVWGADVEVSGELRDPA